MVSFLLNEKPDNNTWDWAVYGVQDCFLEQLFFGTICVIYSNSCFLWGAQEWMRDAPTRGHAHMLSPARPEPNQTPGWAQSLSPAWPNQSYLAVLTGLCWSGGKRF